MDPRKFVVNPKDLSYQEIESYREINRVCKIGRWHCHNNLFFVEAIHFYDWVFYGTIMIPVVIDEQRFFGVAIAQFDCEEGSFKTAVRTANIPVIVNEETRYVIVSRMVDVFTPVGRELNILSEDGHFSFEMKPPRGHDFPTILEDCHINWDGDPEDN